MNLRLPAALAAAAALTACHAAAAESQTYDQCQQKAAGVTVQLQSCNVAELAQRDASLNQTYQQALSALPAERQEKLRTAERTWLAFADAECDFRMSAEVGGTDAPLVHDSCRLSLMAQRIGELQQALQVARDQK